MRLKSKKILRGGENYKHLVNLYKTDSRFAELVDYIVEYKKNTFGVSWENIGYLLECELEDVKLLFEGKIYDWSLNRAFFTSKLHYYKNIPFLEVYLCDEVSQFLQDVRSYNISK